MRNIVSIKTIDEINPIENADAIACAKIGGWNAVVKKNEFTPGQKVIYCEVDSFLPTHIQQFAFLASRGEKTVISPQTQEKVVGHVLKTIKLRGIISQGLVLSLEEFGFDNTTDQDIVIEHLNSIGVFKYESPVPEGSGAISAFPSEARKTDSERVQNLTNEFLSSLNPDEWQATEKIDGRSSTFIKKNGILHVASRNWEVDVNNSLQGKVAEQYNLFDIMPDNSIIQGEIFGEGLQNNPLKMKGMHIRIFYAYSPVFSEIFDNFVNEYKVPVLDLVLPYSIDDAVAQVYKMKSFINPSVQAEGVVWWNILNNDYNELGHRPNFKAINNYYLMKHGI